LVFTTSPFDYIGDSPHIQNQLLTNPKKSQNTIFQLRIRESGLTLNLYKLIRQGLFRPGHCWESIFWTRVGSGEQVGSVCYEAYMGGDCGRVRLRYTTTRAYNGEKRDSDYTIALEATPQPLGGRRWWFVCPKTGSRVGKLHLPSGAFTFASRRAYRLGYRSQRETPRDRAVNRAFKLRERLGGTGGIGDFVPKPKWMRWTTYESQMARIEAAEGIVDAHMCALIEKFDRLHPR
jgi:hypothetical protein